MTDKLSQFITKSKSTDLMRSRKGRNKNSTTSLRTSLPTIQKEYKYLVFISTRWRNSPIFLLIQRHHFGKMSNILKRLNKHCLIVLVMASFLQRATYF